MKIKINLYDGKTGMSSDISDDNFICSGLYLDGDISEIKIGVIGEKYNLSNEDAIDLIEIAVIQNGLGTKIEVKNFFVMGFFEQMNSFKQ